VLVDLMVKAYGPNGRERPPKAEAAKPSRSE
jgi:hypothetical protein